MGVQNGGGGDMGGEGGGGREVELTRPYHILVYRVYYIFDFIIQITPLYI